MSEKKNYEVEAVKLLRNCSEGVLTTISSKFEGYPFGSFITYITDRDRGIIIFASNLAEHTTNIKNNSKSCFTIFSITDMENKQDNARMSLIGDFNQVDNKRRDELKIKLRNHLPESEMYLDLGDFNFYKMSITNIRWIGGFGKIGWLNNKDWINKNIEWEPAEKEIIDHMNQDHSNSIISTLSAQHSIKDKNAKMTEINIDGYYCQSDNKLYFLSFKRPCFTVEEVRKELVVHARENRKFEI